MSSSLYQKNLFANTTSDPWMAEVEQLINTINDKEELHEALASLIKTFAPRHFIIDHASVYGGDQIAMQSAVIGEDFNLVIVNYKLEIVMFIDLNESSKWQQKKAERQIHLLEKLRFQQVVFKIGNQHHAYELKLNEHFRCLQPQANKVNKRSDQSLTYSAGIDQKAFELIA